MHHLLAGVTRNRVILSHIFFASSEHFARIRFGLKLFSNFDYSIVSFYGQTEGQSKGNCVGAAKALFRVRRIGSWRSGALEVSGSRVSFDAEACDGAHR